MSKDPRNIDPDDFFADTRMSFGDHIEDLRVHLWRAIKGFFFACLLGFVLGKPVLTFIAKPVEEQLQAFYDRRVESIREEMKKDENAFPEATRASDWFQAEFSAKQWQLMMKGESKKANAFEKPEADEDDVVKLWMRYNNPLDEVIATHKAQ